ncbi:MAG: pimeloyl-ACP methyl ester carboxylesterase [Pseudohongiellaceae bacterium]|jgi:pimeloyl-ACP methyl ester carboxylesterase
MTALSEVTQSTRQISCPDGLTMTVDLVQPAGGPAPLTLLCHGFKGFRQWGMFPHLAERLAAGGRAVALFDLSHNGTSGGVVFDRLDLFETQTVSRHRDDLLLVLETLWGEQEALDLDVDQGVSVVGHSLGGGVALLAAARDARITKVVSLNGVSHFQRVPEVALEELERNDRIIIRNGRTGQDMPLGRPWFDNVAEVDLQACCQSLQLPVLILAGDDDLVVPPREAVALEGWLAQGQRVALANGDHTLGARHPWVGWSEPLQAACTEMQSWLPSRS